MKTNKLKEPSKKTGITSDSPSESGGSLHVSSQSKHSSSCKVLVTGKTVTVVICSVGTLNQLGNRNLGEPKAMVILASFFNPAVSVQNSEYQVDDSGDVLRQLSGEASLFDLAVTCGRHSSVAGK